MKATTQRFEGKWISALDGPGGSMRLYEGNSANKAEDMTQIVNGGLREGAEASVRRETVGDKKVWCAVLGIDGAGAIVREFGSRAGAAADWCERFNQTAYELPQEAEFVPGRDDLGGEQ